MRGRALVLVLTLLLMSWAPATMSLEEALPTRETPADGTYDVLMLGNSYTSQNSLSSRVQALFDASGSSASLSDLTGGGMKLYQHADNAETSGNQWNTALTTNQYDFVILQDQSQVPSFPTTESMWQSSKNGAVRLDSMIESAGAETIFFMTWGYRNGDSNNAWLNPDYPTMQANLESGYRMYAENVTTSDRQAYIAPVGLAFKVIYDDIIAEGGTPTDSGTLFHNLYSNDGSHPSTRGTYLAACVMHSTVTGDSSIGLPDQFGLDSNTRLKLQQAADSVVFNENLNYVYPWQNEGVGSASNISFGSQSGSNFIMEPGISAGIAVNISNNASFTDLVNIHLISDTGWNTSWSNGDGNPMNGYNLSLASNELQWVEFSIGVPLIQFGQPLAYSQHTFTVRGISGHDGAIIEWTFTIEVLPWHGAEIPIQPENATVDPDLKVRVPVSVRNLGNEAKTLAVRIRPLNFQQQPISGQDWAISFQESGWSVGIFELYNVNGLGPYSTGTVQLEFDAPLAPSGTRWVEFSTWSVGAPSQISTTILEVSIQRTRELTMDVEHDCDMLNPGGGCSGTVTVQNLGNFEDTFEIIRGIQEWTEWLDLQFDSTQFSIAKGETVTTSFNVQIANGLLAGDIGTALIVLESSGGFQTITESISVEVDAICDWIIVSKTESSDDLDNITIAYTLRNVGNTPDGLDVTLSTNLYQSSSLIPPLNSVWESPTNTPNNFLLHDVPVDSTVTFRAWIQLPNEPPVDDVATIEIEMHSELDPSIFITNQSSYEYKGSGWDTNQNNTRSEDDIFAKIETVWLNWHHVFISIVIILVGSIGLFKAVEYRQRKDAEWDTLHHNEEVVPEKPEDWMDKFDSKEEKNIPVVASPGISADVFEATFKLKSSPKAARTGPSEEVVNAAQTVLAHHDQRADYAALEELAEDLLDENIPHTANEILPEAKDETSRTIRHSRDERVKSNRTGSDEDLDLEL